MVLSETVSKGFSYMVPALLETQEFMPHESSEEDLLNLQGSGSPGIRYLLVQTLMEIRHVRREFRETKEASQKQHDDIESRLRTLEKESQESKWKLVGIMGLLSATVAGLISAIIQFFAPHKP